MAESKKTEVKKEDSKLTNKPAAKPAAKPATPKPKVSETKTTPKPATPKPSTPKPEVKKAEVPKADAPKAATPKPVATQPKKKVVVRTLKPKTELPKEVFGIEVNKQAIFDVILSERAAMRQGTHKVKNKGEVSGSGIKPWKQKGTGRARAGYRQSPIWVGGARAFGPTPERNYTLTINKKIRKLALASSLTLKAKSKNVFVTDIKIDKISTKELMKFTETLDFESNKRKIFIITEDEKVFKSASNIKNIVTSKLNSISVEKIVNADVIVFSEAHIKKIVEVIK